MLKYMWKSFNNFCAFVKVMKINLGQQPQTTLCV